MAKICCVCRFNLMGGFVVELSAVGSNSRSMLEKTQVLSLDK